MKFVYLDASALVKRYVPEVGAPLLDHLFVQVAPHRFIVFNIGIAEVVSILVRKKNGGKLSAAAFSQAILDLGAEILSAPTVRRVAADDAMVTAAVPLIVTYSINSTDGVLLRSALDLAANLQAGGNGLVLVTSDRRLLKAAQAEGLVTFDPVTQTQADLDALLVP